MSATVSDYIDVRQRSSDLGLNGPGEIVFLPRNLEDAATKAAFVYEGSLPDVRMLFKEAGIVASRLDGEETKPTLVKENAFDWVLPTVFFAAAAYKANPDLFKLIVSKLWEHSKIVFTAVTGRSRIKWDIIIEDDGTKKTKKISFDGAAEEFPKVQKFIEKVVNRSEKKE